jgi:hypothetical protein
LMSLRRNVANSGLARPRLANCVAQGGGVEDEANLVGAG